MWKRVFTACEVVRPRSSVAATPAGDVLHDFRDMPSPKGLPFIGTTLSLIAAGSAPRLHEYVHKRHKELGQVYRETLGPVDAVFVADPMEMRAVFNREGKYPKHVLPEAWLLYNQMYGCRRGLFFMNDSEWLNFRKIMNKLLLLKSDCWLVEPCAQVASGIVSRWHSKLQQLHVDGVNEAVITNLEEELYRLSIDTLIAVLLGDKYSECATQLEEDVAYLASIVHLIFLTSTKLYLIPATWAARFKLPAWNRFVNAADDGLNIANKLTKTMMYDCPKGNGLVSKMMEANMNENDIARIVVDLILAAGDTTAYSMQWAIYLLAKNQKVQTKLTETSGETHTGYMKGVIREALRLYPVAPFLTRILPQETSIGGYLVPAGSLIVMSLYTSSRNPKHFLQPERFWPERWHRTGSRDFAAASPYASLPFAIGARSCIGRKIAEIQMQSSLDKITDKFRLELATDKNVEMILRMVSVPSTPIHLKITARN